VSQLIQTRPYITAKARQNPIRGQDPRRRHFWKASLIMYIVEGRVDLLSVRQNGLGGLIRDRCSLSQESFYKSNNDLHSMIGGFMLRGEMDLTSINLTRWTRHETAEHRSPLSYTVSVSILLTCT
jgi:hypothetical protein